MLVLCFLVLHIHIDVRFRVCLSLSLTVWVTSYYSHLFIIELYW